MNTQTADEIVARAARLAFFYYQEIGADDPDYALDADVAWVLETFPPAQMDPAMPDLVAQVIIDPTGAREAFTQAVYATVTA